MYSTQCIEILSQACVRLWQKVPREGSEVTFEISAQASMWVKVVKLTKKTSARSTGYVDIARCRSALKEAVFVVESFQAISLLVHNKNEPSVDTH